MITVSRRFSLVANGPSNLDEIEYTRGSLTIGMRPGCTGCGTSIAGHEPIMAIIKLVPILTRLCRNERAAVKVAENKSSLQAPIDDGCRKQFETQVWGH